MLIICSISRCLTRKQVRDSILISISIYLRHHQMELKITLFTSITFNIIGIDVNLLILILCKDLLPMSSDRNISMISRLCIQKITTTDLKLSENILIDLWNSSQSLMSIHLSLEDQLIIHLRTKVSKAILT